MGETPRHNREGTRAFTTGSQELHIQNLTMSWGWGPRDYHFGSWKPEATATRNLCMGVRRREAAVLTLRTEEESEWWGWKKGEVEEPWGEVACKQLH